LVTKGRLNSMHRTRRGGLAARGSMGTSTPTRCTRNSYRTPTGAQKLPLRVVRRGVFVWLRPEGAAIIRLHRIEGIAALVGVLGVVGILGIVRILRLLGYLLLGRTHDVLLIPLA